MNPTKDPLAGAAGEMNLPLILLYPTSYEPDLFFDGDRFMRYLSQTFATFDVMTFSQSKGQYAPLKNVDRLIYGLIQRGCNTKCKEKRYMMNNHVKLFICYSLGNGFPTIYLGSQNLTHGTNLNIMYKVKDVHVAVLTTFFDNVWNKLRKESK